MLLECIACREKKDILNGFICSNCRKRGYYFVKGSNPPQAHRRIEFSPDPNIQNQIRNNRRSYSKTFRKNHSDQVKITDRKSYEEHCEFNSFFRKEDQLTYTGKRRKRLKINRYPITIDVENGLKVKNDISFIIMKKKRKIN